MCPVFPTANGLGDSGFCVGKGGARAAGGGHEAKPAVTQAFSTQADHDPAPA